MKVALISTSARLDDAVGKYTFYLARTLATVSNSKVDVVLAGPMSPEFSTEKVRLIHFETLSRRIARWIIDLLPASFANVARFRFRGWGLRSVKLLAQEISSAELVWDVFASSSIVHRIPLEMRGQAQPTFVFDYHGITSPELVDPPLSTELRESIEELKKCAPNSDHYVVHSKFMAEELAARTGITKNVDVIGLFCDPELIAENRKALKLSDRFVILFVGRASKHKGIDTLIQALKIVRERKVDACVVIAGNSVPTDRTVQQMNHLAKELGVSEHLFWLGNLNMSKLREAYATADVLVLPSRHEGFGLPAIEAMWCDIPVIVSTAGALPEVVGNGALVFKTNDCQDLAEKIILLHENAEIRHRTLEAARTIRESYTLEKFAENVREICEKRLL